MAMIQMESPLTTRRNSLPEEEEEEIKDEIESKTSDKEDNKLDEDMEEVSNETVPENDNTKRPHPKYQYSQEELMRIGDLPLSKVRPSFLDPNFNNAQGKWDPEIWYNSKRSKEHGSFEDLRGGKRDLEGTSSLHKRRSADPKERLKEDRDELVLSPQRRSFGTGCHVAQPSSLARRTNSPTEIRGDYDSHSNRRLGNGRMMSRGDKDRSFRNRDRFDLDDGDSRRFNNSRFGHSRNMNDRRYARGRSDDRIDEEEEPEWFSGGPTSQSETIELVGFETSEDSKKIVKKAPKPGRESHRKLSVESEEEEKEISPPVEVKREAPHEIPQIIPEVDETLPTESNTEDFDLNEILKLDWDMSDNGGSTEDGGAMPSEAAAPTSSRFSQWFKLESPVKEEKKLVDSSPWTNGTAPVTTNNGGKHILDILNNANMNISHFLEGKESTYSVQGNKELTGKAKSLEELEAGLKKIVIKQEDNAAFNKLLKQIAPDDQATMTMGPIDKSKVLQEKDLLYNNSGDNIMALLTDSNKIHPSPSRVLSHPSQRNVMAMRPTQPQQQPLPTPQQQQQDFGNMIYKLNSQLQQLSPRPPAVSPIMYSSGGYPPAEHQVSLSTMMQRQRDVNNFIKQQQQQQHNRLQSDMFLNIPQPSPRQSPGPECLHPGGGQGRTPSPIIFGQQPPSLSHAPAPIHPGGGGQSSNLQPPNIPRVPSPQELAVHTQSILQQALIKRKLEEQKEKSRKQDNQRARSPNNNYYSSTPVSIPQANQSSKGPTTFTPPAVMRKYHSENKELKFDGFKTAEAMCLNPSSGGGLLTTANPIISELEMSRPGPKPIHGQGLFNQRTNACSTNSNPGGGGRPIVKGNNGQSGSNIAVEYFAKNNLQQQQQLQQPAQPGKMFNKPSYMDPMSKLLAEQQRQVMMANQRQQQSVSQMAYGIPSRPQVPRPAPQQPAPNSANMNPHLLRSYINQSGNPNMRVHPSNPLHQLSSSLQQPQQQTRVGDSRPIQARGIHPMAFQQLMMNSQQQPQQPYRGRPMDNGMSHGQLGIPLRGAPPGGNRQSPVNLAKWFNNDMLKMPTMPPVPRKKALLVEEVERQHSSVVHN